MSVTMILVVIALILTILAGIGKVPLWIPVLLMSIVMLMGYMVK